MRVATLMGRVLIAVLAFVAVLAVVSIPFAFGKSHEWGIFVVLGVFCIVVVIGAWAFVGRAWPRRSRWTRPAVVGALYLGSGLLLQYADLRYGWELIQWTPVLIWPLMVLVSALCAFSPGCGN